jgi:hypothetical protein
MDHIAPSTPPHTTTIFHPLVDSTTLFASKAFIGNDNNDAISHEPRRGGDGGVGPPR